MYPWQEKLNQLIGTDPYRVWTLTDRMRELSQATQSMETITAFLTRCKLDLPYYVNTCCDTFNPRKRKSEKDIPFFLDLRQAEYLLHLDWCVQEGKDRVCVKSRYTGGSWLESGAYDTHEWLFTPGYISLIGSRTIELVEAKGEGNMSSLLGKFDYIINRLPPFVKPIGYEAKNPFKVELSRYNPAIKSQINGEPVTENFGSGPRASKVFIDELSKCQNKEDAWVACGQTSDCRSAVYTPKGRDFAWGLAFPDEYSEQTGRKNVERPEVFRIFWKDITPKGRERFNEFHILNEANEIIYTGQGYSPLDSIPLGMGYDDGRGNITRLRERQPLDVMPDGGVKVFYPWYEEQKLRYDEASVAQELDINFDTSVSRRVYTFALHLSRFRRRIERSPDRPLYFGLDPGRSQGNAAFLIWCQFNFVTGRYEFVREYTNNFRDAYFYVPLINGLTRDYEYLERGKPSDEDLAFFEESRDPIWRENMGFGDPFIENKGASNDSWKSIFIQHDIMIRCNTVKKDPWSRVQAFREMLPFCDFSLETVPKFKTAVESIAMPAEKSGTVQTANFNYEHHKTYSHPVAAGEYIAVNDPHKHDHGVISNDEEDEPERPTLRGNRVLNHAERTGRNASGRSLPNGYTLVNGVLTPTSSLKRTDPAERFNRKGYADNHLYEREHQGGDGSGYGW